MLLGFIALLLVVSAFLTFKEKPVKEVNAQNLSDPVPLNLPMADTFVGIEGWPATSNFGAYVTLPVDDRIFIGLSSGLPRQVNGSLMAQYQDGIFDSLKNTEGRNPVTEQGVHDLEWHNGVLYIPGTDPCCGYRQNAGNVYTYDDTRKLILWREDPDGNRYLPDVIHSLGIAAIPGTNELHMVVGANDPDTYYPDKVCTDPATGTATCMGSIYKTDDNGEHWSFVDGDSGFDITPFRLMDIVWFQDTWLVLDWNWHYNPHHKLFYQDTAGSWQEVPTDAFPDEDIRMIEFNGRIITATTKGVYTTNDNKLISVNPDFTSETIDLGPITPADAFNVFANPGDGYLYMITTDNRVVRSFNLTDWETVTQFNESIISLSYWQQQDQLIVSTKGPQADLWAVDRPESTVLFKASPEQITVEIVGGNASVEQFALSALAPPGNSATVDWNVTQTPDWINSVSPGNGQLNSGESETLNVNIDTNGLAGGVYSGTINIQYTDGVVTNTLIYPVQIDVLVYGTSNMITPTDGSQLQYKNTTFRWEKITDAEQYVLDLGSSPGSNDYGTYIVKFDGTSWTVTDLPINTQDTIYVRLWTMGIVNDPNTHSYNDYTYTSAQVDYYLEILPDNTNRLVWKQDPSATEYKIYRNTEYEFDTLDQYLLSTTTQLSIDDTDPVTNPNQSYYYKIVVVTESGSYQYDGSVSSFVYEAYEEVTYENNINMGFAGTNLPFSSVLQMTQYFDLDTYFKVYKFDQESQQNLVFSTAIPFLNNFSINPTDYVQIKDEVTPYISSLRLPLYFSDNLPTQHIFEANNAISISPQYTTIKTAMDFVRDIPGGESGNVLYIFDPVFGNVYIAYDIDTGEWVSTNFRLKTGRGYYFYLLDPAFDWQYTPIVQADLNVDQLVNIQDYIYFSNLFGSTRPEADINGDATINIQDYIILSNNFGN